MKRSILIFALLNLALIIRAQNNPIDEMFNRYSEKEGFTYITISSRMFSMIANLDAENKDADDIIHNLNSIRILTADSLHNQNINFYAELTKKLDISAYEELMVVKEAKDVTKFLVKYNGDRIAELLIISGGPGGNSLISIKGNLNMKNISNISRSMDVKELKTLEESDKKKQR
jgi:hypothetical protein